MYETDLGEFINRELAMMGQQPKEYTLVQSVMDRIHFFYKVGKYALEIRTDWEDHEDKLRADLRQYVEYVITGKSP